MKKISFNKKHVKTKHGVPTVLKVALIGTMAVSSLAACEPPSDDCTTTTTDISNPDLGQQQDPNTNCDSD